MVRIGKRELASLGLNSSAGEPPRKSTRRGPQGRTSAPGNPPQTATPPAQQLGEEPPAEAEATTGEQVVEQPPAEASATPREELTEQPRATVAGATPLEQLENGSVQVASEEGDANYLCSSGSVTDRDTGPTQPLLRVCAVCADERGEDEFPSLEACTHQADTCRQCLSTWVEEQRNTQAWNRLTCPSSECTTLLTQDHLQLHVTREVFER